VAAGALFAAGYLTACGSARHYGASTTTVTTDGKTIVCVARQLSGQCSVTAPLTGTEGPTMGPYTLTAPITIIGTG
jgi:hypothetical protein